MRRLADEDRLRRFMRAVGTAAREETRIYFTGGVSALLMGWRETTVDVDFTIVPERDDILRLLPVLKNDLELNVELASPAHFLPELPGWQDRCVFIAREGLVSFFHYDFYAQALAKIERGHRQDLADVDAMIETGLVERGLLQERFENIAPDLYRFPAVDPTALRRAITKIVEPK